MNDPLAPRNETEDQRLTRKLNDTTKSDAALKSVADMLSTFDGVALGDAFKLAGLVQKYGDARATEATGPILDTILTGITRSLDKAEQKSPRETWREEPI